MSKRVHSFPEFLAEAKKVEATVTGTMTADIPKSLKDKILIAAKISKEIDEIMTEMKKKLDPMQAELTKYSTEILNAMDAVGATKMTIDNVTARIEMSKGRITTSYKNAIDEGLKVLNKAGQKALMELIEANTKQNPDKYSMSYEIEEGIKDVAKSVAAWFRDVWSKVKAAISGYSDAAKHLEEVVDGALGQGA